MTVDLQSRPPRTCPSCGNLHCGESARCGPCERLYWEKPLPPQQVTTVDDDFLVYDPRIETPMVMGTVEQNVAEACEEIDIVKAARMIVKRADWDERAAYDILDQLNAAVKKELHG